MVLIFFLEVITIWIFVYSSINASKAVNTLSWLSIDKISKLSKNNTKDSCKIADYDLIWVNNKMVRDTKTNKVYPQKDGKIAIVNEEDMTSFNVRLMVVA